MKSNQQPSLFRNIEYHIYPPNEQISQPNYKTKHSHDGIEPPGQSECISIASAGHELPKNTYGQLFDMCESQPGAYLMAKCKKCGDKVSLK